MNDVNLLLPQDEIDVLKEFLEVRKQYNALDKRKDELSDKVKEILNNHKIEECDLNGTEFVITKSIRKQAKRGKKDDLISKLIDINKGYLILSEPSIDFDTMKEEFDNSMFPEDVWNDYVTTSEITTLRVK